MQVPPPLPPDPNLIIGQLVPIAGMATGIIITGMLVVGPIGRAVGDIVRHLFGVGRKDETALPAELGDLRARLDGMQHQMAELAERQDFTERMLAQVRKDRAIPGGTDVAG